MNSSVFQLTLPPLAIVDGVRSPFAKAFTALAKTPATTLGRVVTEGVLNRSGLQPDQIDEVVFGNVAGPAEASNIARVIALQAGIPQDRPAHTVNRNCASGMESVIGAWQTIREKRAGVVIAGGVESMSNVPLLWDPKMADWLMEFRRASLPKRMQLLTRLRPAHFKPVPALSLGLTDPVCGLNMGETAEVLAQEFSISREAQDLYALQSHQRATAAWDRCFYRDEVVPVLLGESGGDALEKDVGPRAKQSMDALTRLKPMFDRESGTITAGNSCPITDGAAALLLMSAEKVREMNVEPLGWLRGYAIAACDPRRMGLGPVYAIHRLLQSTGAKLSDFELFEINEAFAAQVLSCLEAISSADFAREELQRDAPLGDIDRDRLNIHGGAIALGHPVGASGTRLILTLLRSLQESGRQRGLAALCVGGGQGAAMWLERTMEESS